MYYKKGNQTCIKSHRTGKSLGCYPSKKQAQQRMRQIKSHSRTK